MWKRENCLLSVPEAMTDSLELSTIMNAWLSVGGVKSVFGQCHFFFFLGQATIPGIAATAQSTPRL